MGTALKLWLLIDVPYLSTLVCLIAEQGLIREQDERFPKIVKRSGAIKRAGWNQQGVFLSLLLQKILDFVFLLLKMPMFHNH